MDDRSVRPSVCLSVRALGIRVLHKKVPTALEAESIRRTRSSSSSSSKPQSDDLDRKLNRRRFGGQLLCVCVCVLLSRSREEEPGIGVFFSLFVCWFLVYTRSPIAHTLTRLLCTISSTSRGVWCGGSELGQSRAGLSGGVSLTRLGSARALRVCCVFLFFFLFKYMLLFMCVCVCVPWCICEQL